MIEYQETNLTSVSDDISFTTNSITTFKPSSVESNSSSSLGSSSQSLSTASSLSPVQLQQYDWPEFHENYNSIMDNTNLLDSCAEALCDISTECDRSQVLSPEKILWTYNRSLSLERSSSDNLSVKSEKHSFSTMSSKSIDQFSNWLQQMEEVVESQPKISKLFAMNATEMTAQKDLHSKFFKEISARSCIVKGFKQNEFKWIEERYHLLYLKVYEVLLLLEGSLKDNDESTNQIIDNSESDVSFDDTDTGQNTSINTKTNRSSTNIGVFTFKYEDPVIRKHTKNDMLSSTICEFSDKEFTFESDLQSLFNSTDLTHSKTFEVEPLQQQLSEEAIVVAHQLPEPIVCESQEKLPNGHHKVYDWLYSNRSDQESTAPSLESICDSDSQSQKSCQSAIRMDKLQEMNCQASVHSIDEASAETNSLVWDNFLSSPKSENGSNDMEISDLMNDLCYFGDDYSMHLETDSKTASDTKTECSDSLAVDSSVGSVDSSAGSMESSVGSIESSVGTSDSSARGTQKKRRSKNKRKKRSSKSTCSDSTASTIPMESVIENDVEFVPDEKITYNSDDKLFEVHSKESAEPKKMKIGEMRPEDFYDIVKMCQSNIDCVITVLGAEPNRILTVSYCQQMKYERYKTNECNDLMKDNKLMESKKNNCCSENANDTCVCAWVSHTIAMLLNFLIDCWNIFRNMKLYTYLCRVTKALFSSTRYVADHIKRQTVKNKAIKFL